MNFPEAVPSRRDPRIRDVEWMDLVPMSRAEVVRELSLGLPWLLLSLVGYHQAAGRGLAWLPVGLAASFYFFLAGLRQVHQAHHDSLGLPRRAQDLVMVVLSVLMLSSMHAIQVTHLHHHRHCLGPEDVEGSSARLPWYRAIALGPLFVLRLHLGAFRLDRRRRRLPWILLELVGIVSFVGVALGVLDVAELRYHVAAMAAGQCLTGFFAVWTVHHDCDGEVEIGRTQRGRLKNLLALDMFFHVEHHLFPAVPNCHQPELARRIDAAIPEAPRRTVW